MTFKWLESWVEDNCQCKWDFNPFLYKPWFLHICSTSLLKTLWEKEKLFIAISSFPTVFSTYLENFLQFSLNLKLLSANTFNLEVLNLSFGKGLKVCCLNYEQSIENECNINTDKGSLVFTSIFSCSHNVFYPTRNKSKVFNHMYFVICKCFEIGPAKYFVVW